MQFILHMWAAGNHLFFRRYSKFTREEWEREFRIFELSIKGRKKMCCQVQWRRVLIRNETIGILKRHTVYQIWSIDDTGMDATPTTFIDLEKVGLEIQSVLICERFNVENYRNHSGGTISLIIPKLKNMEEGLVSPYCVSITFVFFPSLDLWFSSSNWSTSEISFDLFFFRAIFQDFSTLSLCFFTICLSVLIW